MKDLGPLKQIQLTEHMALWQRTQGHRVGTDDVICAWAGMRACPDAKRILDLGCGHGAVTLMLAEANAMATIIAVEAQDLSYTLLRKNIDANNLEARIQPVHGDFRQDTMGFSTPFDLVTGTPPFMPLGTGTLPDDPQRAAARFEFRGGIEAYCDTAARHLTTEGVVSLVMDGQQPKRCELAFEKAGLHLYCVIRVIPKPASAPVYLILQGGLRDHGSPTERNELVVRDQQGALTERFCQVRRTLRLPGSEA